MLHLRRISLRYREQQDYLLKDLSHSFSPGRLCVLTGANGSGKTSILNIICGIIPLHSAAEFQGQVIYGEEDITRLALSERSRYLCVQMADPEAQFFFPALTHELSFPVENMGLPVSEIRSRLRQVSEYFGLGDLLQCDCANLSRGQQKLVLRAICAMTDAPVVLLDEPCSGISGAGLELLYRWIEALKQRGKIVIAAEHEPGLISRADSVIELSAAGL